MNASSILFILHKQLVAADETAIFSAIGARVPSSFLHERVTEINSSIRPSLFWETISRLRAKKVSCYNSYTERFDLIFNKEYEFSNAVFVMPLSIFLYLRFDKQGHQGHHLVDIEYGTASDSFF